jgi:hypothetical protein
VKLQERRLGCWTWRKMVAEPDFHACNLPSAIAKGKISASREAG